jgi:plasmid stabilization system protein ParE
MARVLILPRALSDVEEARNWYEEQREGLGLEFYESFEASLRVIRRFPAMYPVVLRDIRRCLMGRFPYGIIYRIAEPDGIILVAVLHGSRDPEILQGLE